jgi:crystallin, alpha B
MVPRTGFSGPWSLRQNSAIDAEPQTFRFDSKGFSAFMDVHMFDPKEISVKTIDHTIIVECRHEPREDEHGHIERELSRKFHLPFEYDMSTVKSSLSKDGILLLEAPKPQLKGEEQKVEIHQTEKPSFLMSLLSNRAHSMLKRSHSIPSDNEED